MTIELFKRDAKFVCIHSRICKNTVKITLNLLFWINRLLKSFDLIVYNFAFIRKVLLFNSVKLS